MKIALLGGGLASLLAAYELKQKVPEIELEIFEKSDRRHSGGLLRTVEFCGRKVDVGGPHIMFSSNNEILKKMLKFVPSAKQHKRIAKIAFENTIIDYPIENGIWRLPEERRKGYANEMLQLLEYTNETPITSMQDFFEQTFGRRLARDYFIPYNTKIWKTPPSMMETTWTATSGRLPTPTKEKLLDAAVGIPQEGYEIQSNFWYPSKDGIYELYENLLKIVEDSGVEVKYDAPVNKIIYSDSKVCINTNASKPFDYAFSSLPLVERYEVESLNSCVLRYNPVITVLLKIRDLNYTINNIDISNLQVLYVPPNFAEGYDTIFHRLIFVDKFQSSIASLEDTVLMAEITGSSYYYASKRTIVEAVMNGLIKLGFAQSDKQLQKSFVTRNDYGYPVDVHGTSCLRNAIVNELRAMKVASIGRWGKWSYWNMDKVYADVLKEVGSII